MGGIGALWGFFLLSLAVLASARPKSGQSADAVKQEEKRFYHLTTLS